MTAYINHDMLLLKLRSLGVPPSALEWFNSYLKGKYQHVRIGDAISQSLPLDHGVPQESFLGPVLFTVYINDLLSVPEYCQTVCYVDVSKLYLKFKTSELCDAISAVNSDLREICRWCCQNSLLMNPDKTKLLVIGVPKLLQPLPDLTITPILLTPVAKDLGVLDQRLSYDEHISKTVSSCMNKLIQINRLFYCSSVWGNTSGNNIHKLQLQNLAATIIFGLRQYDHFFDGLRSHRWLNVKQTRG